MDGYAPLLGLNGGSNFTSWFCFLHFQGSQHGRGEGTENNGCRFHRSAGQVHPSAVWLKWLLAIVQVHLASLHLETWKQGEAGISVTDY